MNTPNEPLIPQMQQLRQLFADALPTDPKIIRDYAWIIAKALNHEHSQLGSVECRQLLNEYLKLPIERPSKLHSAILSAAVKVANTYPDFRFAAFLRLWNIANLRAEDNERQHSQDGRTFPSLTERTAKALAHSLILHSEDRQLLVPDTATGFDALLAAQGFSILSMLVTRMKEGTGKDGRKYRFVTLTSADGMEAEVIANVLQPTPLRPLPEGKRHYANIGQLYDVVLRRKTASLPEAAAPGHVIAEAFLSSQHPSDVFPSCVGYIESIDIEHSHMHVYDAYSRHFVAPVLRFSKERAGDFVRFIPIVPQQSKFKTAILLHTLPATAPEVKDILRDIRITTVNPEKGYATWELIDKSQPITEQLSPLQLSQGETSPVFVSGFLHLSPLSSTVPSGTVLHAQSIMPTTLAPEQIHQALIFLKRGKDHQKRAHVAKVF